MKLTQQQRNHIEEKMASSITDGQYSDSYWYEHDDKTLIWSSENESYVLLNSKTDKFNWIRPRDVIIVIEGLCDATLIEWYCEENCCEFADIEEYIADELEVAE
jgi:hypothetical protein